MNIIKNEPMKNHTTFRIGGAADEGEDRRDDHEDAGDGDGKASLFARFEEESADRADSAEGGQDVADEREDGAFVTVCGAEIKFPDLDVLIGAGVADAAADFALGDEHHAKGSEAEQGADDPKKHWDSE